MTPTHGSFGSNILQTPKSSSVSTHFQDAFTTPQMASYATPQPQQYSAMTPVQRPQTSSETLRSNYYANIQASGGQNGVQAMFSPGQMVSPTYGNTHTASMQLAMNTSFDSTQMQTPPPTRGTSARKPYQSHQVAFGTPSTIASRRYMTPQQAVFPANNGSWPHQTPVHFPQLQFSPDMYQFANLGPASAPVMPQTRVLWDQSGSPIQALPQSTLADPFAPTTTSSLDWPMAGSQLGNSQSPNFNTPAMNSFPVQAPQPRPASAVPLSAGFVPSSNTEAVSTGVDPSLLYSSPAHPVVRPKGRAYRAKPQSQMKDSQNKETVPPAHNRTSTVLSTDTALRGTTANLQRSNTTGTTRPKSANFSLSATESLHRSNSINQVPRTASPVKRFGRPSLGAISEGRPRQRPSVILTVDENGRARTETRRVDDSSTRSIRERYPALFDSDSSEDESDASDRTPSRPSSFIFDKRDERKSKAAKLDPTLENLEGLSIPRSNSAASMKKGIPQSRAAVAAAAQLRRQGSLRRSTPSRNQNRASFMSSSTSSLIDTAPMDLSTSQLHSAGGADYNEREDNSFDWAANNFQIPSSSAESTLDAHNRRWSMMSEQQHGPLISPQHHHLQNSTFQHHARPPQTRQYLIRCVCGIPDDRAQSLVQCRSCTQWLHAPCVGLEAQQPPPNFTCFLCTKPAPFIPTTSAR